MRYVNPFAIWTDVLLKSGRAALESLHDSAARARPRVVVLPASDAPQPSARRKPPQRRARPKAARANARPAPKRKLRSRSAKAPARRR